MTNDKKLIMFKIDQLRKERLVVLFEAYAVLTIFGFIATIIYSLISELGIVLLFIGGFFVIQNLWARYNFVTAKLAQIEKELYEE
jgi:hypothetical protein